MGSNKLVYHDEFVATEIGQVGTQFDGLGHVGVQVGEPGDQRNMRYYNGVTEHRTRHSDRCRRPERGRRDGGWSGNHDGRCPRALKRQGMEDFKFMPGDYIIFRTG